MMDRFVYGPDDPVEVVSESDLAGMGIRPVGATAESRFIYAGDDPVEVVTEDELDSLGIDPIPDLGDEDDLDNSELDDLDDLEDEFGVDEDERDDSVDDPDDDDDEDDDEEEDDPDLVDDEDSEDDQYDDRDDSDDDLRLDKGGRGGGKGAGKSGSGKGYNPNRARDGKFAKGVRQAKAKADRAGAGTKKAAAKLKAAKEARKAAVLEARAAIGSAKKAAAKARKDPTPENKKAARTATTAARRAAAKVTKTDTAVAKQTERRAAAKEKQAEARAALKEAKKPSRVDPADGARRGHQLGSDARAALSAAARGDFVEAHRAMETMFNGMGLKKATGEPNWGHVRVVPKDDMIGVSGLRHPDGRIDLRGDKADQAKRFVAQPMERARRGGKDSEGMAIFVHETLHGYSPGRPSSYRGRGAAVEEITTEIASRSVMGSMFGVKVKGAYTSEVTWATKAIAKITGKNHESSFRVLQDASLQYKRRASRALEHPDQVYAAFSQDISRITGKSVADIDRVLGEHLDKAGW